MKKISILMSMILLIVFGCKKDNSLNYSSTLSSNERRLEIAELDSIMDDFMGKIRNEEVSQTSTLQVEDAMLVIEAGLNYTFCHPHDYYDEIKKDTFLVDFWVPLDKDGRYLMDGELIYNVWSVSSELAQTYDVTFNNPNDPFPFAIDIEFVSYDSVATDEEQHVFIRGISYIGNPSLLPLSNCIFTSNDYWKAWGVDQGCSTNSTNTSSRAIKEIQRRFAPQCRSICSAGYYSHITTPSTIYPTTYGNGIVCSGLPLFWYGLTSTDCLSPSNLDCYVDGGIYMADDNKPNIAGVGLLSILGYEVIEDLCLCNPTEYTHALNVVYGKCHAYTPD